MWWKCTGWIISRNSSDSFFLFFVLRDRDSTNEGKKGVKVKIILGFSLLILVFVELRRGGFAFVVNTVKKFTLVWKSLYEKKRTRNSDGRTCVHPVRPRTRMPWKRFHVRQYRCYKKKKKCGYILRWFIKHNKPCKLLVLTVQKDEIQCFWFLLVKGVLKTRCCIIQNFEQFWGIKIYKTEFKCPNQGVGDLIWIRMTLYLGRL